MLESCLPDMGLEELVELGSGLAGFGYQPDELWRDAFFTAVMEYEIEQWGAREAYKVYLRCSLTSMIAAWLPQR